MKTTIFIILLCGSLNLWANSYSTSFPLTEFPISQGGMWVNGGVTGLDWTNCFTSNNIVSGFQHSGNDSDATALLTGTWGPTQYCTATVWLTNVDNAASQELEIRLRSTITAHSCTGYECNFSARNDGTQYFQIVRWNGALGNFTLLDSRTMSGYLKTGVVISAGITNSTITTMTNGVVMLSLTDTTYTTGNPGIGFYDCPSDSLYGFTQFTASDGITTTPTYLITIPGK